MTDKPYKTAPSLTGAHTLSSKDDHANVITKPPFIYLGGCVLGWMFGQVVPTPLWPDILWMWSLAGYLSLGLGTVLLAAALFSFFQMKQNPDPHTSSNALYTGGVYKVTRNPMYVGMALYMLAYGAFTNNLWVIFLVMPVVVVVHYGVIKREESYLRSKFGKAYKKYCKRVHRWV